jgi:peptidase E
MVFALTCFVLCLIAPHETSTNIKRRTATISEERTASIFMVNYMIKVDADREKGKMWIRRVVWGSLANYSHSLKLPM